MKIVYLDGVAAELPDTVLGAELLGLAGADPAGRVRLQRRGEPVHQFRDLTAGDVAELHAGDCLTSLPARAECQP